VVVETPRNLAPPTPGEVLRRLLHDAGNATQEELAEAIGVSRYSINQLVNNRRTVTAEMALRLAQAFTTTPEFWLDLQRQVDLHRARIRIESKLRGIPILRRSPSVIVRQERRK
jgi:antitoxin HigA-1